MTDIMGLSRQTEQIGSTFDNRNGKQSLVVTRSKQSTVLGADPAELLKSQIQDQIQSLDDYRGIIDAQSTPKVSNMQIAQNEMEAASEYDLIKVSNSEMTPMGAA